MISYNLVLSTNESTVVAEYIKERQRSDAYQSEAALEKAFIKMLTEQGYEYIQIHDSDSMIKNLQLQLEKLNNFNEFGNHIFFNFIFSPKLSQYE